MVARFEHTPNERVFYTLIGDNGERLEAHAENTKHYFHLGRLAIYDHIIVAEKYVWPPDIDFLPLLRASMIPEDECEQHLKLRSVSEETLRAYQASSMRDLWETDMIPPDWLDDEGDPPTTP